ncbi:HD-GYP domain-containing protein (c-di-GMP phosphodiesterase class II) [Streptosporangium saharense]|uniref:HD-GYP domain-containing protein (C-di-GMP phosphodiesterase class II) n=1 Tax=Streptosporangium saharense TaxID=1706840 RepID=A0A7W7QSM2_9ACTN|nr:HD-GYP domain-containing protein [Streptosporangium saharense]MBB4918814.1 HD-GYP domain-containing protein (c-di-GMP phosphodiesterase class II) [Streptosporangium saharense]
MAGSDRLEWLDWSNLLVLALLFLVCESVPTLLNVKQAAVSVSFSAALAAVVLVGPQGAALVGMTAVFSVRPGLPLVKRLFNGAQFAICGYAAGWVYESLGGKARLPDIAGFDALIVPFAGAAAVFVPLNFVLIAIVLVVTGQADQVPPLRGLAQFMVSYLGYATFGLLIAGLWATVNSISAVLVLLPLFVARWAFGQYVAQQRSYDATIAALCQAVETKDYYTRGHCTRVSLASGMIAQEIGMGSERLRAIRYAGMLHDVGKLGVPTKVLQKDGPLTEEEYAAIQLHPMRGLEIVRGIDFLDEAFAGIMHHHERQDGKGYPMGLAGEEIPEFARIIAVADAFDSMTSDRSYRGARPVEVAMAELRKGAGTQFDPEMVVAFTRAVDRHGWEAPRKVVAPPEDAAETTTKDHDDPTMPIQVVPER